MNRFADARAKEAMQTGLVQGLPKKIGRKAHWIIGLLIAAHSIQDVGVIGRIAKWRGRFGLLVQGKWFVTFGWEPLIGATEIKLERR